MAKEMTEAEMEAATAPTKTVGGNVAVVEGEATPKHLIGYIEPPDAVKAKNFACMCGEKLIYNAKEKKWKCAKFYTDEQTKSCQIFDPTEEDADHRGNKLGFLKHIFTW